MRIWLAEVFFTIKLVVSQAFRLAQSELRIITLFLPFSSHNAIVLLRKFYVTKLSSIFIPLLFNPFRKRSTGISLTGERIPFLLISPFAIISAAMQAG